MTFKKFLRRLTLMLTLYVLAWSWFFDNFPMPLGHCEEYTKDMNGGVRSLAGQPYRVTVCGLGRFEAVDGSDVARFQVHTMSGDLLAERYFTPNWQRVFELEYEASRIIYRNGGGRYWESSLNMPPTWLDWVRARLYPIPPFDALMAEMDHWFHRKVEPPQHTPCEGCRIEEIAPEDVPEALRRAGIKP